MAVLTFDGRSVLALLLLNAPLIVGVGEGDPEWDALPPPDDPETAELVLATETDLVAKVGVTRMRDKYFVIPDVNGSIVLADGARFSRSLEPTRHVYLSSRLDLPDASGTVLREAGVYFGVEIASSVPSGQMYIPEADIVSFGPLVAVGRFPPIVRNGAIAQAVNLVINL